MTALGARLVRCPDAFEPERGREAADALPGADQDLARLLAGAGGSSPHLHGLILSEAEWLGPATDDPEAAADALIAGLAELASDALSDGLRRAKRRLALLVALADLGGVWPLETVTGRLSDFADAAVAASLRHGVAAAVRRGKLPGVREEEIGRAGGLVVVAMGKWGAGELNYSSDIDLICLFDETRFSPDDYPEARAGLIRVVRGIASGLSEMTAEGYVFRTDLRLRPDAAVTPVAMAMAAAEQYYESVGRTWERAAYVKARPAAGDLEAGTKFLETLRPFVWRKHLDFAAIQDAHDMRLRIRDHKRLGGPLRLEGHDLKLGRGGIREIEFFTQTRQLIAGGRDPSLRVRGTVEGLARLAAAGWVPQDVADRLTVRYRAHREVEHRLQMVRDAQTHALPQGDEGFDRLAALMGTDAAALRDEIARACEEVHELTEGFFAPGGGARAPEPEFGEETTARWPNYPALRSTRAVEIFNRLRPEILRMLGEASRPEEALASFDGFLQGLPAGVQLFSLFEANPDLTRLIVDIAATAPALARYLSSNAGVFDAVIAGDFFAPWPGRAALEERLVAVLAREGDYEKALDAARVWAKEWHFRIGVHHLRGLIGADEAGAQYAELAETCLSALWPVVVEDFSARHGPPPGRGAMALGMGSLGAGRLTAASDLDLIVIYDAAGVDASDGRRPLAARAYYARLTQALVTAMTAPTAEGKLYEVDMRLRPSGRQGPVATAISAFRDYQLSEAWTWEHLALTRARPVAGSADLAAEVEAFRRELIAGPRDPARVAADVAEMRERIASAKAPQGEWDTKIGPGRLQDVELAGQMGALLAGSALRGTRAQIAAGRDAGLFTGAEAEALTAACTLLRQLQTAARLLTGGPIRPKDLGDGGCRFVLRETGQADIAALARELAERSEAARDAIGAALARSRGD